MMVAFSQKWLYSGISYCIRAKVVVFGKSGCIRTKWLYSGKVLIFGKKVVVLGQSGCIRAKMVVIGQNCYVQAKFIV